MNFFTLLTVVLITLKLMGYITWSWFVVFSPLLIGIVFFIIGVGIITSNKVNSRPKW